MKNLILIAVMAIFFAGCSSIENSNAINTERQLAAAGFQMQLADTPARLEHVKNPGTAKAASLSQRWQSGLCLRRRNQLQVYLRRLRGGLSKVPTHQSATGGCESEPHGGSRYQHGAAKCRYELGTLGRLEPPLLRLTMSHR